MREKDTVNTIKLQVRVDERTKKIIDNDRTKNERTVDQALRLIIKDWAAGKK